MTELVDVRPNGVVFARTVGLDVVVVVVVSVYVYAHDHVGSVTEPTTSPGILPARRPPST